MQLDCRAVQRRNRDTRTNAAKVENDMKTIEAQVPDAVLQQARDLAERERIPLEQLICLAVTQTIGVWSNESYLATQA